MEPLSYYGWPTFPSVLWCCWLGLLTCKTVSRITYTVLVETLNPAQSNLGLVEIQKFCGSRVGYGVFSTAMFYAVWNLKSVCISYRLFMYRPIHWLLGAKLPDPYRGSTNGPPNLMCPPYLQTLATPLHDGETTCINWKNGEKASGKHPEANDKDAAAWLMESELTPTTGHDDRDV